MSDSKKETEKQSESRRQFLKGLGVAAAASAVSTVASTSAQADVVEVKPEDKPASGYRETQHIRDYYDSL
ncbi:twin-arginine translocation signal domain-containing protein [Enterovibrio nigricans]|uniref:Formate dehydrogenase region TAT target n=1 Tax=Enterovibrio nigricans DSM 22720 TaxID=1121868 RepID=A0A1T4UB71_9GAMM|nr:twin-arginine translocation signal domain-containing protein [Enterovibrio nigricans]PKF51586.1 transcriptional initiation protein Tat [Enterovibrio nigricans]SKA49820.1 formate dehydrogenase region TAT target [Enterovibrio nigricans DSM 22720]